MIVVNGERYAYESVSVDTLIAELGIEPRGIAVARNGEVVRRSQWTNTMVVSGDLVEVVTAAAGG